MKKFFLIPFLLLGLYPILNLEASQNERKEDIRNIGSGNIGATNVLRTGSKLLALLTLIFDVGKGYLITKYALIYYPEGIFYNAWLS